MHVLAEDVPTQVASFPPSAATTASHVASAPALPVHVPRDSEVHAAPFAGWALSEQAVLADAELHVLAEAELHVLAADVHVFAICTPLPAVATVGSLLEIVMIIWLVVLRPPRLNRNHPDTLSPPPSFNSRTGAAFKRIDLTAGAISLLCAESNTTRQCCDVA